jgi:hypothetical protein
MLCDIEDESHLDALINIANLIFLDLSNPIVHKSKHLIRMSCFVVLKDNVKTGTYKLF